MGNRPDAHARHLRLGREISPVGIIAGPVSIIAPKARRRRPRPRRIFPFGFARQTIVLAGLLAEPLHICTGIFPADARHRMRIILGVAWVAPAFGPVYLKRGPGPDETPVAVAAGGLREHPVLASRHLK